MTEKKKTTDDKPTDLKCVCDEVQKFLDAIKEGDLASCSDCCYDCLCEIAEWVRSLGKMKGEAKCDDDTKKRLRSLRDDLHNCCDDQHPAMHAANKAGFNWGTVKLIINLVVSALDQILASQQ